MEKTPPQTRPRWVQVLGKAAFVALPAALVLGLILDATDPPGWISRTIAVAYVAIVVAAMLVSLWLVMHAEDRGGPSDP